MQKIKLFVGIESDIPALEDKVNEWIAEHKIDVVNIFGNISPQTNAREVSPGHGRHFNPSDIFIAVVYRDRSA